MEVTALVGSLHRDLSAPNVIVVAAQTVAGDDDRMAGEELRAAAGVPMQLEEVEAVAEGWKEGAEVRTTRSCTLTTTGESADSKMSTAGEALCPQSLKIHSGVVRGLKSLKMARGDALAEARNLQVPALVRIAE